MVFSSLTFIYFFLPITIALYYLLHVCFKDQKKKVIAKNILLLIVSLIFYGWGGISYLLIIVSIIIINYLFARWIVSYRTKEDSKPNVQKALLIICLVLDLGVLFYFKYFNFMIDCINAIARADISVKKVVLPIGISFFTFQAISYIVDVYKGKSKCQKNILYLALYISFFPQLIAGPIIQYNSIEDQLENRHENLDQFVQGIIRFCFGLGKKVLIANSLAFVADKIFDNPTLLSTGSAWIGIIFYTFQILYDFSGYSDMAIGLGKMFGFEFTENFDNPYMSLSIAEFWRRWHISLGAWFREYIYIPLGGNRKGLALTCLNLFIVFLLTGIWHGANWTFILWGVIFGIFIVFERLWFGNVLKKNKIKFLNWIYTFVVVILLWVLFRSKDLGSAMNYYKMLFSFQSAIVPVNTFVSFQSVIACVFAVILMGPAQYLTKYIITKKNIVMNQNKVTYIKCGIGLAIMIFSIYSLTVNSYNPFIYFNF